MALINRCEHVYWELVPLEGTPQWRSFIINAYRFGLPVILFVQVFQKGESSSQVHEEVEDVDESDEEGEQQEAEARDSEGDETSRGYVVTVLTVYMRIKFHLDLQVDKSSVVAKGPFFPQV
jgi:hypothetical protein